MGGNVFQNCEPFDQKYTPQLLDQLNTVLKPTGVQTIPIGSTADPVAGKFSGDIDVIVEQRVLKYYFDAKTPKTVRKMLKQLFDDAGYQTAQSGVSVHVNLPLQETYHQADIMVVDHAHEVSKFHVHKIPPGSVYRGVNKHLALMYLSKKSNLLWSAFDGLYTRDGNGKRDRLISRNLDEIAYILLGKNSSPQSLDCLENIMDSMPSDQAEQMLEDLKMDPSWREFS